jgi:hypothetical protein
VFVLAGCSSGEPNAFEGFRVFEEGEVLTYRIVIAQRRTASGLGDPKTLKSKIRLDVEEEPTETGYTLVVRDAAATGEQSQRTASKRLVGRRIAVNLEAGHLAGDVELFSGGEDVAAADIGLLHAIFAPILPDARAEPQTRWRAEPPKVRVPWSQGPLAFTVDHEVTGSEVIRELEAARVRSRALANLRFRLPLVEQAKSSPGGTGRAADDTFIVNELFEELFTDIDNPVQGLVTAIAAIPLAILAPFLAIGEAIGDIFGTSDDESKEPEIPVVDLAGPLSLTSSTAVWRADGRVLAASAEGTAKLAGTLPQLPGEAAKLSGKPLSLDSTWKIERKLTSPWPDPRPTPGRSVVLMVLAVVSVIAGATAAGVAARRRRSPARSRDAL